MSGQRLVIDACSAINLLATGREVELLRAVDFRGIITPEARAEVVFLAGPLGDDGAKTKILIDMTPLDHAGLIETLPLDGSCIDEFIRCAVRLRDVDAGCLALAASLGLPLLTDDGKARRVFKELYPDGRTLSTLQLVRQAAATLSLDEDTISRLLHNMHERGNFSPPRSDPESDWYRSYIKE